MNRVVMKFKSVANGEVPMDDISDWTIEHDDVDKFLFHTEGGFSKKERKKWDGTNIINNFFFNMTVTSF